MPMIDVYAGAGTFHDKRRLARELASRGHALGAGTRRSRCSRDNTAAFIHDLPDGARSRTSTGVGNYVRVQVLTPVGTSWTARSSSASSRSSPRSSRSPLATRRQSRSHLGPAHRVPRGRVGHGRPRRTPATRSSPQRALSSPPGFGGNPRRVVTLASLVGGAEVDARPDEQRRDHRARREAALRVGGRRRYRVGLLPRRGVG